MSRVWLEDAGRRPRFQQLVKGDLEEGSIGLVACLWQTGCDQDGRVGVEVEVFWGGGGGGGKNSGGCEVAGMLMLSNPLQERSSDPAQARPNPPTFAQGVISE